MFGTVRKQSRVHGAILPSGIWMRIVSGPVWMQEPAYCQYELGAKFRSLCLNLLVFGVLLHHLVVTSVQADDVSAAQSNAPTLAPLTMDLRAKVLGLDPAEIGVAPSIEHPKVWGLLMETGYPNGVAMLLILADGTVSLYYGHGGGIIGGGSHANVWRAAQGALALAQNSHQELTATTSFPMPDVGRVGFYFLTFSGVLAANAKEIDLGNRRHELSDLFYASHKVIAELRQIVEAK